MSIDENDSQTLELLTAELLNAATNNDKERIKEVTQKIEEGRKAEGDETKGHSNTTKDNKDKSASKKSRRNTKGKQDGKQPKKKTIKLPAREIVIESPPPMPWHLLPNKGENSSGNVRVLATKNNLEAMLAYYGCSASYDVIRKEIAFTQQGRDFENIDHALAMITDMCAISQLPLTLGDRYLNAIAYENKRNPVLEYIHSQPWDGKDHIGELFKALSIKAGFNVNLAKAYFKRWFISGAAAADDTPKEPFRCRGVLVFQGDEGLGKGAWFKSLLGSDEHMMQLINDGQSFNADDKDTLFPILQSFICECAEINDVTTKKALEKFKIFVTRQTDVLRKPYGKGFTPYKRKTIFCGSVNPSQFLDQSENTRFWTIPLIGLNHNHNVNMQQVWAQAWHLYKQGEQWWLTKEEEGWLRESNQQFKETDILELQILDAFDPSSNRTRVKMNIRQVFSVIGYTPKSRTGCSTAGNRILARHFEECKKNGNTRLFLLPEAKIKPLYADT